MAQEYFEKIPAPWVSGPTGTYNSPELLYSTAGFTQKGVTLKGGLGVIPIGTIMGRNPETKCYEPVTDENGFYPAGIMRRSADLGGEGSLDQQGNIVIQGIVKLSLVKGASPAVIEKMKAVVDPARDTFKF